MRDTTNLWYDASKIVVCCPVAEIQRRRAKYEKPEIQLHRGDEERQKISYIQRDKGEIQLHAAKERENVVALGKERRENGK